MRSSAGKIGDGTMPSHNAKPLRNAELYRRWKEGERLCDLAREYGITPQRATVIAHEEQRLARYRWLEEESRHS